MSEETNDTLSYNVFGLIEIREDRVRVVASFSQSGRIKSSIVDTDFKEPLKNFEKPFSVSFGAWAIKKDDIYVVYQENLEPYDFETFKINFNIFDKFAREAVNGAAILLSEKS